MMNFVQDYQHSMIAQHAPKLLWQRAHRLISIRPAGSANLPIEGSSKNLAKSGGNALGY
jgi:hypothetical protein